jgi:hypothetical protein
MVRCFHGEDEWPRSAKFSSAISMIFSINRHAESKRDLAWSDGGRCSVKHTREEALPHTQQVDGDAQ